MQIRKIYIYIFLSYVERSWKTDINHFIVYFIQHESLFNETCVQCVPLEMVYEGLTWP